MPPETEHAIDKGNVYHDKDSDKIPYIVIDGFYIDEAGHTQIRVMQYTDKPLSAHNSAGYLEDESGKRTLTKGDIRDRILKGELEFEGKE